MQQASESLLEPEVAKSIQKLTNLFDEVLKDIHLKKGKKAKFIKHLETSNQIYHQQKQSQNTIIVFTLAALFKNLGKLGEDIQSLEKSIQLMNKIKGYQHICLRWTLQMAALKSSKKMHQECYSIASKAFQNSKLILKQIRKNSQINKESYFIDQVMKLAEEKTRDQIVWVINERSLIKEILYKMEKSYKKDVQLPFYPNEEFHIADYMTLDECENGWKPQAQSTIQIVVYLSISCFTMATQSYYLKDYTQKDNHLKALKIGLAAFSPECSYNSFLVKILNQHFGQRLQSIEEERVQMTDAYQMRKIVPKDKKEVCLKYLKFQE